MSNTVEILESIGIDARLRYAKPVVLSRILVDAKASEALKQAVTGGDKSLLINEFRELARENHLRCNWDPVTPQISNLAWREEPYCVQGTMTSWRG